MLKILLLTLSILLSTSAINAASLIPICSEAKTLKKCPKNKLAFPTYAKDQDGLATFSYKIDQGELGELSFDEISSFTDEVLELWSSESNINFEKVDTGVLEIDVDASNFNDFIDKELGYNLIIWDAPGEIIEKTFGKGSKSGVLGYATAIAFNFKKGKISSIKESQSLLNGFLFDRENIGGSKSALDNLFKTTILHEFAHMFGLDHTQGGNLEGYNNSEGNFTDIPVMFPAAANPSVELHEDDVSAIKLAYPRSEDEADFASISGSLTQSGVGVKGANIVAYKLGEDNPKLFAVASPSDVDGLGTGNYLLPNLNPGNYVLYAEPLDSSFTDGSSIGFHQSPADFTQGFYNGSSSFLNLSFDEGINQAQVITVNAGDNLNIDIDIDGNPLSSFSGNNGEATFLAGGRLINGNAIKLANKKAKGAALKLVNLEPGEDLNIKVTTDFPDLVKFKNDINEFSFKKRSKKVKIKLAKLGDFLEDPFFIDLEDPSSVSFKITIEDLDTGFTRTETIVVQ